MRFKIRRAFQDDEDNVFQFLSKEFYPDEPLYQAIQLNAPQNKYKCRHVQLLRQNLSFLAVLENDPSIICGVILNEETILYESSEVFQDTDVVENSPHSKMKALLKHTKRQLLARMQPRQKDTQSSKVFDICVISVGAEFRRQNLALRLMEVSVALAKQLNYHHIIMECSSAYSAALATSKFGFTIIFHMPMNEYKDADGEIIFKTKSPHNNFITVVKPLLDAKNED